MLDSRVLAGIVDTLHDEACRQAFSQLPGYRQDDCGRMAPAAEVFEGWPTTEA